MISTDIYIYIYIYISVLANETTTFMCDLVTMVDSDDDDVVLGEVISLSETHFKS